MKTIRYYRRGEGAAAGSISLVRRSDSGAGIAGSGPKDPRVLAANIIKMALGVLGTIFLVLTVYAGFLWMTASGEEEKITKAKDILKASIIGLLIILTAYAITSFVISNLVGAIT